MAVDPDGAPVDVVQTDQELEEGGLARDRRAEQAHDPLAGGLGVLVVGDDLAELAHRVDEPSGVAQERDQETAASPGPLKNGSGSATGPLLAITQ